MLKIKNIIFILAFLCLSAVLNQAYGEKKDALAALLNKIENTTLSQSETIELTDQLIEEAKRQNNKEYLCKAYFRKLVIEYNSFNIQEARKWIELLEPLALEEKQYDLYFRAKQCFIDLMLLEGELEKGEEEAKKLLKEAHSTNNQMGVVLSHLSLSHAYSMSYREDMAAQELEKAYQTSSLMQNELNVNLEILHALIASYDNLGDHANHLKYLKKQEKLLRTHIQQNPKEAASLESSLNLVYILFVSYYLKTNSLEIAKEYLDSSKCHFSDDFSSIYKALYYKGSLKYYEEAEDYPNALWCVDSLLRSATIETDQYQFQATKARILFKSGALKEATALYENTLLLQDSLHATLLNKQIEQIQSTEENNKVLLEKEQLQRYISLSLLFFVLAGLIMLIWYIIHKMRVRNYLGRAEHEMRLMSLKMETANIAKDKFLNNISQTISPPLNTIVASSTELADNKTLTPQKKEELSAIVLKTTEALMVLINNILDLSRLEAGMMKFGEESISPISHIQLFLDTTPNRKVGMIFQVPKEKLEQYTIVFDSGKFSQLLDSVFTKENEIGVSFNVKDNRLEISIIGSALASEALSQEIIIQNEINLLLVQHFKGEYLIHPQQSAIGITLPITFQEA